MTSISDRLRAVSSGQDLHLLLSELANDPESRWTRTQVLFYLPDEFHGIAADYFEGERIRVPQRRAVHLATPSNVDLTTVVEALRQSSAGNDESANREPFVDREIPILDQLVADPPRDENDVIGNTLAAILEEARVVDRDTPKRYRLSNGKCVGPQGQHYVYVFSWSSEPDLFMPGELRVGEQVVGARVGRQGEGDRRFEIWTQEFLGGVVDNAIFRIDPTFLLRSAFVGLNAKRDVFDSGGHRARELFCTPDPAPRDKLTIMHRADVNPRQRRAIETVGTAHRAYVWGPPGTGKTTSLGNLLRALVDSRQRVLVLSPYNIAVDEAVLAAERIGRWSPEQLVRVGRLSDKIKGKGVDLESLLERRAERSGLLENARAFHAAIVRKLELKDRPSPASIRGCLEELGSLVIATREQGRRELSRQIADGTRSIREAFRVPERDIVGNASVVGTTVALSYLSPMIHERLFDHIVVDEASVVRVPEALLVALAATNKLTFFGDPKQLPPIVKHRSPLTDRWLKPNPFDLAGIKRPDDAKGSCIMLTEQHRMAPPIRALVSTHFYEGALEDGRNPKAGRAVLVDTSLTPARTTTKWVRMSPSKENLVHRQVVAGIITAIRERDKRSPILVLSPYVGQRRRYDAEAITNRTTNSRFATVHTSQGTESEIVILDLVIAPGRGKSRFMNEKITPEFRNLLNVAISRAKTQLIVVGHVKYVQSAYPGGLLDEIFTYMRTNCEVLEIPASLRMAAVNSLIVPQAVAG